MIHCLKPSHGSTGLRGKHRLFNIPSKPARGIPCQSLELDPIPLSSPFSFPGLLSAILSTHSIQSCHSPLNLLFLLQWNVLSSDLLWLPICAHLSLRSNIISLEWLSLTIPAKMSSSVPSPSTSTSHHPILLFQKQLHYVIKCYLCPLVVCLYSLESKSCSRESTPSMNRRAVSWQSYHLSQQRLDDLPHSDIPLQPSNSIFWSPLTQRIVCSG